MKISIRIKLTILMAGIVSLILTAVYFFLKTHLTKSSVDTGDPAVMAGRLDNAMAVSFLFALAAVVVMSYVISSLVTRRVKTAARAARAIARGNYHHLYLRTGDEIEDLADAINDVSLQIKARIRELDANKSRLEATFLSMFDGVMILDREGGIVLMNQTLTRLLEITEIFIGKKPIEVIRNQDIQDLADIVVPMTEGVETQEIAILHPQEKIFMIHATSIQRDGKPDGAVLVFHDITSLRKLEQVRRDFVANVSHELRTPMTNIKGYSETLLDGALEDPKVAREFVEVIKNDADRLTLLIDDLLHLARIESGKSAFDKRLHDLRGIVDQVVKDLMPQAHKSRVTVLNMIGAPVYAPVDSHAIEQVFFNLIDNAIKYNHEGGQVSVAAHAEDNRITISVADTGMGIPPEDLPRVFERFYRVDKAHSRKLGGTGLGLSIVKHIVQLHGGEITVDSEPGRGSVFRIILIKGN